jgi:hypothetical protein
MGCGKEFEPICVVSILVTLPSLDSIPGIGRDTNNTGGLDSKPDLLYREWLLSFMAGSGSCCFSSRQAGKPMPVVTAARALRQSWHRACGDIHRRLLALPCLALRDETRHVLRQMRQAGSPAHVGCLSRRGGSPLITFKISSTTAGLTDELPRVTAHGIGFPDLCSPLALAGARLAQTLIAYCTSRCAETPEQCLQLPETPSYL